MLQEWRASQSLDRTLQNKRPLCRFVLKSSFGNPLCYSVAMNPLHWFVINYQPRPEDRRFLDSVVTQERNGLEVRVAVLDAQASRSFFGIPMARRGIQPVWVQVTNRTDRPCRLQFVAMDPNYFSPLEAAAVNHFSGGRRLLQYGLLAWLLFLPVILLFPLKLWSVWRANGLIDALFHEHAFRMRPIPSHGEQSGFVFTNLSLGSKVVLVRLMHAAGQEDFEFTLTVPGLDADYLRRELDMEHSVGTVTDVDESALRNYLAHAPATTTNKAGTRHGDPLNLVVIGDFPTILGAFGARWDETEAISLASCWKTAKAFLVGTEYRYSPVSSLYMEGRSQDVALQRIRNSINERVHLRLWIVPLRFRGQPVWLGQVSRDIGVRFTWKTWNLTTHRIDPDVDEARDYVMEDLMQIGRLDVATYAPGAPACDRAMPQRNLTGDPYYSDGKRAVVMLSKVRATPRFVALD